MQATAAATRPREEASSGAGRSSQMTPPAAVVQVPGPFAPTRAHPAVARWYHRLPDLLLTRDTLQRMRLAQCGLGLMLLGASVAAMFYFAWTGHAPLSLVAWWAALSLGGMLMFYALIRAGWSRRLGDASLAAPQMVFAITSAVAAYALLGAGRGGVFPIVMVVLMFGMFGASLRQMLFVSLYAVVAFALVMSAMATLDPLRYPPAVELGHFLMVATMMPAVAVLAARMSRMRQRSRTQRAELAQALARIRELATRDELTGLINARHMHDLLEQEHQRCVRSGQTFCVALVDLGLPDRDCDDTLVHALAQEAQRQVRVADVLARWRCGTFLLLMPDTRAAMARGGLERLHAHLAARAPAVAATAPPLAAVMAEHRAGESVAQTLARVQHALEGLRAHGVSRVVSAA
jgi:diguanylate cyclase (GGDEF)-like protein